MLPNTNIDAATPRAASDIAGHPPWHTTDAPPEHQAQSAHQAPQAAQAPQASRWLALLVLLIGAFLPPLDFTVVNLALPTIRDSLGASSSAVQFVISAYAATYAVFLITGGRLGDLFGRKRMFLLGVTGFTLASALCGLAWSPHALIAGRILQGLMATMMAPQVLASIRVLFPPAEQTTALGLYGATFGLANVCGQVLGGLLVSAHPFGYTWQAVFLINLPIGIVAVVGGCLFLRDSREAHAQKLDIGGVLLLSATLALLVYPLVEGRETGWPWWLAAMLAAMPFALAAFIRYERTLALRGGAPLVELALFRNDAFVVGILMATAFYMQSSFLLTFSVYLQNGLHLTPRSAGLTMLPYVGGGFAASLLSSRLMQRMGVRALTLGFVLQVVGFGVVALAVCHWFFTDATPGLLIAGLGFGVVMPSVIKAVIGGVDARHAGLAAGVAISALQIGASLGVAIIGGVFYTVLGVRHDATAYAHALAVGVACNVVLLALGACLSWWLSKRTQPV